MIHRSGGTWLVAPLLLLVGAASALFASRSGTVVAYRSNPNPGVTGGFGERSCHVCHSQKPLNESAGSLVLEGVPQRYAPGRPYDLTVKLSRSGMGIAGFQLSARFEEGARQAGSFRSLDRRVHIVEFGDANVQYVSHSDEGNGLTSRGTASWTVEWTAPTISEGRGVVVFHLAANAANNDDTEFGDFIYQLERRTDVS